MDWSCTEYLQIMMFLSAIYSDGTHSLQKTLDSRNTISLNYDGNNGSCTHNWLIMLLRSTPMFGCGGSSIAQKSDWDSNPDT